MSPSRSPHYTLLGLELIVSVDGCTRRLILDDDADTVLGIDGEHYIAVNTVRVAERLDALGLGDDD